MKNQVSALMDGELDDEESRIVFGQLKQHDSLRGEWEIYHMIGDSLRQTPVWQDDFSTRFAERLAAEPTVLAPRSIKSQSRPPVSWPLAASVAAVSLVAWTAFQLNQPDAAVRQAAQPEITVSGSGLSPQNVNYYLNAHQEYSVAAIHGASPYHQASLENRQGQAK